MDRGLDEKTLAEYKKHYDAAAQFAYNEDFNSRTVIGDDYSNMKEKGYGNNEVEGPDAQHGTHVAGIIGANRNNNLGVQGVAENVKIMVLRAVPDGDERDKDIANAIIYAVDNGARVINMSFGKSFSPNKARVDEAVKYAEKKGVLLVHAAGNDAKDVDTEDNFPTKYFINKKSAKNWIEVGASDMGKTMSKFTTTAQDGITSITNGKTTRTIATELAKQLRSRKGVSMNEANQLIWDMAKNGIMPAEAKESTLQDDLVSALSCLLYTSPSPRD